MSITEFLGASDFDSHPSAKFPTIGDKVAGTIVAKPRVIETDEGPPKGITKKLLIDVTQADGETVTVWVKSGLMAKAVSQALKTAGVTELVEGATFAIQYTGDGIASPGKTAPKQWSAAYKPPVGGVSVDDLL